MRVKFWYRCRGCGKSWWEVDEYEGDHVVEWMESMGVSERHRCSDRQVGGIEFIKAKVEVT